MIVNYPSNKVLTNDFYNKNIFFIFGNDYGLIDDCYHKLRKVLNINLQDPFLTKIINEKNILEDNFFLTDELNNLGMFGEKRTIIVDIRQYENKNKISNVLNMTRFDEVNNVNLLVVSYGFKKNDKLATILSKSKYSVLISCYEQDKLKIKNEVRQFFNENNITLKEEELETLLYKFSKNKKINDNIFKKIKLFMTDNEINYDDLYNLIDDNNDQNIFEITNLILSGQYTESMKVLSNFKKSGGSSISIIRAIISKIKLLERCFELKSEGLSDEDVVNKKSLNIFFRDRLKIKNMMRVWDMNKIKLIFTYLYNIEIKCKAFRDAEFDFLDQAFLYIYFKIKN